MKQQVPLNSFPDCVFMKLHSAPVQGHKLGFLIHNNQTSESVEHVDLKLTIRFGKQAINVPGGLVWFGLKRGELKLRLENARIPLEKMGLTAKFATEIEYEEQQERGKEFEANLAVAGGVKDKGSEKSASKVKYMTYSVSTRGTEEEPVWIFESQTKQIILKGQLTEELLGTLHPSSTPCLIKQWFGQN